MAAQRHSALDASEPGDLKTYRAKRDFTKTPEPDGAAAARTLAPSSAGARFVIQKHAARRLHYDLRLELDGVFKSWAVTRGPSLDPAEKRLAVHVEDHPLDYGDFEGVIPKGEYGGGTVMIWDRGLWRPEGDPAKGYAKGHLAFELEGEKLRGRWHLIRTRPKPREKKQQWLLFKSDDEFAKPTDAGDVLDELPDSVATGRSLDEIGAARNAVWSSGGGLIAGELSPPGGGVTAQAAKVSPAEVPGATKARYPGFIRPCLALLAADAPQGEGWLHEIKFDGYRLMAHLRDGEVTLFTRSGLDWTTRFPLIAEGLRHLRADVAIIDGEAVIEDEGGVSDFSALQAALRDGKAASQAIFYGFDLLYLDGYDLRGAALDNRKAALAALMERRARPHHTGVRYSEHILSDGKAMVDHACRLGLEGIISKKRTAPYRSTRGGDWLKIKCTNRSEFVVGGYVPSTATRGAIGSLVLGYYDGDKLIHAGGTGTGFSREVAQSLYKQLAADKLTKSPFAGKLSADDRRGVVFVAPRLVADVEFRGWTDDNHLRHAAFKGLREDKTAREVTLETPVVNGDQPRGEGVTENRMAARPAKARVTTKKGGMLFEGVTLTHPDRILWEGQGLTKLGLAEFYAEIGDYILPHIVGRPLALVRCPSGSEGGCFYQKHAFAGLTGAVEVVSVPEKEGEDEALVIHDLRGLISLVQASVLEIHPWGARIDDIEHPDRIIFDLDPGEGVGWPAIMDAARDVRRRLADDGIESFVKTSGGKGLHVVAPIAPRLGWDEVKGYTLAIAAAMERDEPERYISTMTKKRRTGKIFVDYLRNGRGATAVAAYSTRARPGAPVSAPIRWSELGPAMTPTRFNVDNLPRRLSRLQSDPWAGFFSLAQDLPAVASARK
jgi:bifunctional non-homologous end joining protein LigD